MIVAPFYVDSSTEQQKEEPLFLPFSCEIACASINFMQDWCFAFMLCLRTCALTKSVNQSTVSKLPNSKMGKKLFAFFVQGVQASLEQSNKWAMFQSSWKLKVRWIFSDLPYLTSPNFLELKNIDQYQIQNLLGYPVCATRQNNMTKRSPEICFTLSFKVEVKVCEIVCCWI